jgi:hypothetical protein
MIIRRERRTKNFTVIDNDIINDPRLDWRDLGLLVYLLSKPDNWQICTAHLIKIRKTGRDGIYASLKVLCECGYASKKPNPSGGWDWTITENPNTEKPDTEKAEAGSPNTEFPNTEKPDTEFPNTEKPDTLINTEYSINTEYLINTDTTTNTPKLSGEEQACFEWAKKEAFWSSKVFSEAAFLKLYESDSQALKGQYQNWQELNKTEEAKKQKPKVPEIWERQGFKSKKEYDDFMFQQQMDKYTKTGSVA